MFEDSGGLSSRIADYCCQPLPKKVDGFVYSRLSTSGGRAVARGSDVAPATASTIPA
jgi:hypothetical protein